MSTQTQERFETALSAVTDVLTLNSPPIGFAAAALVLRRAWDSGTGSDDIRDIESFCKALVRDMQEGYNKAYLIRIQAAMAECADAWDANE